MNSFKNTVAASFAVLATVVTVAAATPLRAETVRVPVAYGDIDMQSATGAAQLDARIRRAAERACGDADAASRFQVATCRAHAVKSAQTKLAMQSGASTVLASR